jgi:hypothetical protein
MELTELIDILKARKTILTDQSAKFSRQMLQMLAEGQPVTPERLADVSGQPAEFIRTTFASLQSCDCEFNDEGALMGDALTLTPRIAESVVDVITRLSCSITTSRDPEL